MARSRDRGRNLFGLLVLGQVVHSVEEYVGRLWEVFPPAAALTGSISADRELGFMIVNGTLIAAGAGAWVLAALQRRSVVGAVPWFFVVLTGLNAVGHLAWSAWRAEYTPGVATAPVLFLLALLLERELRRPTSM